MKIRSGFVSNSSSSSFLIKGDCAEGAKAILKKFDMDFYTVGWDDVYTEPINEESELYRIFREICYQSFDMDICCPHIDDKDKYVEVKGECFSYPVYVPKDEVL